MHVTSVGSGPVGPLLDALHVDDLRTVHGLLAVDAVLAVPSLRAALEGRDRVTAALEAVLGAFPQLRYGVTSRYVAPGQVTDEVVLTGVRLGPWGEVPPSGRPHLLPARIVLDHDGTSVTRITLWADAAALRATVDDRSDRRDGGGMPTVTALRATIPAAATRVIVGRDREERAVPDAAATLAAPPNRMHLASARAAELKVPMPRRVRRALVASAATVMAAAALGIGVWVVQGALSAPAGTISLQGGQAQAATPSPTPSASTKRAEPRTTPAPAFTRRGNLITLNTDLTFAVDSARLNDRARRGLDAVIEQVRAESRTGTITVDGYTDSDGEQSHNLRLSRERAQAVAAVLERGLADLDITVRWEGHGETRPRVPNTSGRNKAVNRRVEITVPGTT